MAASDFVGPNFYTEAIAPVLSERRTRSRGLFKRTLALCEASIDFLTCAMGICAAGLICVHAHFVAHAEYSWREVAAVACLFGVLAAFLQHRDGAYRSAGGLLPIRETERALRISFQALALLFVISLLLSLRLSFQIFLVSAVLVPASLILQKQAFLAIIHRLQQKESRASRVVIYGAGDAARIVVSTLLHSPRLGFKPVAVIDDGLARTETSIPMMGYPCGPPVPVQPGPLTPALLKLFRADLLMLATKTLSSQRLADAAQAAGQLDVGITFIHGPAMDEPQRTDSVEVDGLQFTSSMERSPSRQSVAAKRALDLVLSSMLLLLLAPVFLLIAILIHLDSPGPALFTQKRVGRDGTLFGMYKFRSMRASAPRYEPSPIASTDPRITRIGRFLRRTSLDELPQLINVFVGNMSLVGPRPEMPFIVDSYSARQRQRLQVIPGLTGLWQLSPDRAFPIHNNIQYDLYYIRNRNFFMDMAILIHTLFFAMRGGV
jgi:exopolysaccharide biosynthesis polyprenyl glycosylphosphotransferase